MMVRGLVHRMIATMPETLPHIACAWWDPAVLEVGAAAVCSLR